MTAITEILGSPTAAPVKKNDELGQEDFLKLMIAQLKNQDPSNPLDNAEFLGQIAQFSMVSGIEDLGSSFNGISSSLYANQAMQASQLIGREVLVQTNTSFVDPERIQAGVLELDSLTTDIRIQVANSAGEVVTSFGLGNASSGRNDFAWEPTDANGDALEPGFYTLQAEGLVGGSLQALPLQLFRSVDSVSVDRNNVEITVNLEGQESMNVSSIREFR